MVKIKVNLGLLIHTYLQNRPLYELSFNDWLLKLGANYYSDLRFYYLTFEDDRQATFFMLKYSDYLR